MIINLIYMINLNVEIKILQAFNNVNACNFYMTDSEVSIS